MPKTCAMAYLIPLYPLTFNKFHYLQTCLGLGLVTFLEKLNILAKKVDLFSNSILLISNLYFSTAVKYTSFFIHSPTTDRRFVIEILNTYIGFLKVLTPWDNYSLNNFFTLPWNDHWANFLRLKILAIGSNLFEGPISLI